MLRQDLRHALRVHARRPLVTVAAVATLALGVGVNSAIFSIVYGVLQPLDYPRSGELVRVHHTYEYLKTSTNARMRAIWNRIPVSYLNALEWRRQCRSLAAIGLYQEHRVTFTGGAEPMELDVSRVDAGLFTVLGVEPVLGRTFRSEEIEQKERPAVLSHGFWQDVYGGDADVAGRTLRLDGDVYTIVGVMPAGFRIAGRGDRLWTPVHFTDRDLQVHDELEYRALARLAPGASLQRARQEMAAITARLVEAFPEENDRLGVYVEPLLEDVVGESRTLLLLLMGTVAVVLLVACVNVAHLLLARAAERRHELAVRVALGASRRRLVRQLLVESLLLALAGGAGGLLLAGLGRRALLARIPADLPRTHEIALDGGVLLFTLAASLLSALAAGLLPAVLGSDVSPDDLKGGRQTLGRHGRLAHGGFVVAQIALTLMLTAGAGLLVASFWRLTAVDPGFRTRGVVVQEVQLPEWRYGESARRAAFADRLVARLATLPGVESAALTTKLPLPGPSLVAGFRLPGRDEENGVDWTQGRNAALKSVTPDYFDAMGIPHLAGRLFDATDRADSGLAIVVNRTLAEAHWPGEITVGQSLVMLREQTFKVVGVVGDVRQDGIDVEARPMIYQPWTQSFSSRPHRTLFAVLALNGDLALHAPAIRRVVRELDPLLALAPSVPLDELLSRSIATPRSRATLVALFAVLALVLTLIGIYAVMSFTVSRGIKEIGIRMALGADGGRVRRLVLRRTLQLALLGIALGTAGSLAASRLFGGRLYGVEPQDPAAFVSAAALIALVSLLAGYLPARRASRIDPIWALRSE